MVFWQETPRTPPGRPPAMCARHYLQPGNSSFRPSARLAPVCANGSPYSNRNGHLAGLAGDSLLLPILFLGDMTRPDRSQRTIPALQSTSNADILRKGCRPSGQQAPVIAHPE
ncbi:uncharacterized protein TRAVEDRAFT_43316 [Trametes versicolor FP-101664 SS1]|uniref:uncharacterized protein n=1 Tax=Trametes versicolor (strain FP-101664) TaxID=717944 RepID=UPI00046239CB|nr:uncharacterized protein TRAVEDRAFT_43316 [Trametes versicolor FP-101664 SS1]EIW63011.1 hypothetical protein TRAVEDRAFT_43316 [Trametes versicolor FP-101664 SS1]